MHEATSNLLPKNVIMIIWYKHSSGILSHCQSRQCSRIRSIYSMCKLNVDQWVSYISRQAGGLTTLPIGDSSFRCMVGVAQHSASRWTVFFFCEKRCSGTSDVFLLWLYAIATANKYAFSGYLILSYASHEGLCWQLLLKKASSAHLP